MKKLAFSLLITSALLPIWRAHAVVRADTTQPVKSARYGIGIQLGSTGLGIQVARPLPTKARLVARVGLSYIAWQKPIRLSVEGDGKLIIQPDFVLNVASASIKWHPAHKKSFFITAGGGYAWRPSLGVSVRAESTITFGGLEMTPENVGVIDVRFRWSHFVGYTGIGFGRSIPRRRFGLGVEVGCYYLGAPTIDLTYEGFLETTTIQDQVPVVQRNLSGYRYLPSLQFSVTYAIRR